MPRCTLPLEKSARPRLTASAGVAAVAASAATSESDAAITSPRLRGSCPLPLQPSATTRSRRPLLPIPPRSATLAAPRGATHGARAVATAGTLLTLQSNPCIVQTPINSPSSHTSSQNPKPKHSTLDTRRRISTQEPMSHIENSAALLPRIPGIDSVRSGLRLPTTVRCAASLDLSKPRLG
jgi:hypothetical protein